MKTPWKSPVKSMTAGLLLIALAPAIHAQSLRTLQRDPSETSVANPGWDFPDPFHFPPPAPLIGRLPQPAKPISVNELLIPPKAAKEVERSQKAFQSGDVRTSAEHLEKAVKIYPNFVQAHNLLGARYINLGEYEKALAEYHKAAHIDPKAAQTSQNLAFALLLLKRYREAESAARRALELDPELVSARYSLARAILGQGRVTPESTELLRQSESKFPNASLILAQIRFRQNNTSEVIAELRRYLQAPPDADNKLKAECWLAQLTEAPVDGSCPATSLPNFN
jgi:tetratricopeptide (TPR) repeat protein